jgi:acetyl esterase
MRWFWDAYTTDPAQRAEITASPNQASTEQVTGLPPTNLCVDEADVLRDEGEATPPTSAQQATAFLRAGLGTT